MATRVRTIRRTVRIPVKTTVRIKRQTRVVTKVTRRPR